jgi:hypothetical protein
MKTSFKIIVSIAVGFVLGFLAAWIDLGGYHSRADKVQSISALSITPQDSEK